MLPLRPPPAPVPLSPISLPKLLLVEGDTPMHFFQALLTRLGIEAQIEIRNLRGVPDFKRGIADLVNRPEFTPLVTSVGVVRDAEDKPAVDARQSVTQALATAGLVPSRTPPVKTSVFILPDDSNPGMIETLCIEAVRQEPSLADVSQCVDEFFTCLRGRNVPLPGGIVFAKNQAQAYLATRARVQLFPGLAAYQDYWPWDSPALGAIKQFLQAL